MYRIFADTNVIYQSPQFLDFLIAACWRPPRMLATFRQHAAVFETVVPFFYLGNPHGIVTESLLNFENCSRLRISKLLAKLNAVLLLSRMRRAISTLPRTSATDTLGKPTKIQACAWRFPPPLCTVLPPHHHDFLQKKKKVGYLNLDRPRISWDTILGGM